MLGRAVGLCGQRVRQASIRVAVLGAMIALLCVAMAAWPRPASAQGADEPAATQQMDQPSGDEDDADANADRPSFSVDSAMQRPRNRPRAPARPPAQAATSSPPAPSIDCGKCYAFPFPMWPNVDACIASCNVAVNMRQSCHDIMIIMEQDKENRRLRFELQCSRNPLDTWACEEAKKK
jgi:hypothetical protein